MGVAALVVELVAPLVVEERIEEEVGGATRGAAAVEADLDSFPFVTRLLLTGRITRLSVTLEQLLRRRLRFSTLRFELEGIRLDRPALYRRRLELEEIAAGRVTAVVSEDALAAAGPSVDLGAGEVVADAVGHTLVLAVAGTTVQSLPLPAELFPCDPAARLQEESIVVSCTVDEVPALLLRALAAAGR